MPNDVKSTHEKKLNTLLKYPDIPLKFEVVTKAKDKIHHIILIEQIKTQSKNETKVILDDFPYYKASRGELIASSGRWYVGLGQLSEIDTDELGSLFLNTFSKAATTLTALQIEFTANLIEKFNIDELVNLAITAASMSVYPVDLLKKKPSGNNIKLRKVIFNIPSKDKVKFTRAVHHYSTLKNHIAGVRQVQALPGNFLTATAMDKRARNMAKKFSLKCKILKQSELEKIGAGGILAVNQGSTQEPRLIVLEYSPSNVNAKTKTLGLVGKGVTFDTGGISLKPGLEMHEMKYDMSGSAIVMHSIAAIAELGLPVRAIGVMGMVENMPGGSALKPGDVYTSLQGTTVEVQNTDAEGRLVLGDLLHYTEKNYKPDLMIDLATLTGAILVALGPYYAGLFSPNDKPANLIAKAAEKSLEPVWRMPMDKKFKQQLKSNIADYNNIGGRYGGSSSAASFLSAFVTKPEKWAHLDIAGISFIKKSFNVFPSVATGYGVRLLTQVAANLK